MSATAQASLFAAPIAAEAPKAAPVFGRQASWMCFGRSLDARYWSEQERLRPTGFNANLLPLADVSFCYLLTQMEGAQVRIQCPALGFDESGDFRVHWHEFYARARAEAESLSGHSYASDGDACVTTAWQGETRASICNVRAA